ncbi:MAG: hypothetical protein ACI3XI_01825 [Eubacteriales bacterium]
MIFASCGCSPTESDGFLGVLDRPASAVIEGERGGVAFCATVTFGDDGGEIVFSAPESMKGIVVSTAGGVWGSRLGELTVSGDAAELIGAPLKAFLEYGEVVSAQKDGEGYTLITARSGELEREYLIESKSGLPSQIKEKSADGALTMTIKIKTYEFKEEK